MAYIQAIISELIRNHPKTTMLLNYSAEIILTPEFEIAVSKISENIESELTLSEKIIGPHLLKTNENRPVEKVSSLSWADRILKRRRLSKYSHPSYIDLCFL